ncbi:EAL domain-containing protein [Noviherbaspirillum sedimenti]|uniref:EAL domain-containing protein n=1 Tax=Noviherbaspirillum sedimenti TaxID=2320865 RepID=A0A3A3GP18_9BURK|nr:EAL domain-containing protein [Noviherbaspirillum sedimenti]RJG04066.1 EAL domain-containing protein [Noviherbaspirillum sedimenti]
MGIRSNFLTIRIRLALIILVAALPAAGLFVFESWQAYKRAYAEAGRNLLEMAQLAANNERNIVQGVNDLLTAISEAPFIQNRDMLACNSYLEKIGRRYPHYHAFSIIDRKGNVICTGNKLAPSVRVFDRPYFDLVMREKRFVAVGYLVSRVTNIPGVAFALPILDSGLEHGRVIGMVGTAVRLEAFTSLTRGLGVPLGARVSIVDHQGVVLATEPGRQAEVGKPLASNTLLASLFSGKPQVLEAVSADGVARLFAIAPAMHEGRAVFFTIIGLDKASLAAPALKSLSINLTALFSLALLSLIGTWVASKKLLIRPVKQLIDTAQEVASGNLQARTNLTYRGGEIGELAHHFDNMTAALARRDKEMRASSQYIEYLAHHDELTKLPNRRFLHMRLAQCLEDNRKTGHVLAVVFIDLDRFRIINDSLGHAAGDLLLVDVAHRLKEGLEAKDLAAHLGSDEFVCVLTGLASFRQAAVIANKLRDILCQGYVLANQQVTLGASLGVCMCPTDCEDAPTAVKYAEVAMRTAKESGSGVQFFSREINAGAISRLTLENELRKALQQGEFTLYYQPQIDLASNRVVGAETLIRWQHPEKGLLSPITFIALAEETRLILEIGAWTLDTACMQSRAWQDAGLPPIQVAVNVSAHQFRQAGFAALVGRALAHSGLAANMLELEVTESVLLNDVNKSLTQLQAMGVSLSIDDFGTGYSSLSYLKDLPINKLKIDQSFIRNIMEIQDNQAITRAIVGLAKSLGLKVLAEGVDSAQACEFLRELGCDQIQGYYFGKPMPAEQFALLLKKSAQVIESIDGNSLAPL